MRFFADSSAAFAAGGFADSRACAGAGIDVPPSLVRGAVPNGELDGDGDAEAGAGPVAGAGIAATGDADGAAVGAAGGAIVVGAGVAIGADGAAMGAGGGVAVAGFSIGATSMTVGRGGADASPALRRIARGVTVPDASRSAISGSGYGPCGSAPGSTTKYLSMAVIARPHKAPAVPAATPRKFSGRTYTAAGALSSLPRCTASLVSAASDDRREHARSGGE